MVCQSEVVQVIHQCIQDSDVCAPLAAAAAAAAAAPLPPAAAVKCHTKTSMMANDSQISDNLRLMTITQCEVCKLYNRRLVSFKPSCEGKTTTSNPCSYLRTNHGEKLMPVAFVGLGRIYYAREWHVAVGCISCSLACVLVRRAAPLSEQADE
jgi:hypothetical protein